jgi:hypothetical protein
LFELALKFAGCGFMPAVLEFAGLGFAKAVLKFAGLAFFGAVLKLAGGGHMVAVPEIARRRCLILSCQSHVRAPGGAEGRLVV